MKTSIYLYNIEAEELDGMEYFTALQYKYDAATKLYKKLFLMHNRTEDQDVQMFHVAAAQKFTKKLLAERYG